MSPEPSPSEGAQDITISEGVAPCTTFELDEPPHCRSPRLNNSPMPTPMHPRKPVHVRHARIITQEALHLVTAFSYHNLSIRNLHTTDYNTTRVTSLDIAEFCAPVIHPTTGEVITKYRILANDKELSDTDHCIWKRIWRTITR